jgi:hypothetical protein
VAESSQRAVEYMTNRDRRVEHTTRTCIHFNGIQNSQCNAGVKYTDLFGNEPGWAAHMCCTSDDNPSATCDKLALLSKEDAEKKVEESEKRMNLLLKALGVAKEHAKSLGLKTGKGGAGRVKCPGCDGVIHYSVASVNGHMHARCSTVGCVSWME